MSENHADRFALSPADADTLVLKSAGETVILIADDDASIRNFLTAFFTSRGHQVWLAPNGAEAAKLASDHGDAIGLVLLDIQMPVLDGPRACDKIRQSLPTVPIWFMTGCIGIYSFEELMERGARGVLQKPFRMDELVTVLMEHRFGPLDVRTAVSGDGSHCKEPRKIQKDGPGAPS